MTEFNWQRGMVSRVSWILMQGPAYCARIDPHARGYRAFIFDGRGTAPIFLDDLESLKKICEVILKLST